MVLSMNIYTIPGHEYDSNIYVITGEIPTIIDTGTGFHSRDVLQEIQKIVPLTKIQQILLTHEHFDHVGGVKDIGMASKDTAKIFAHKDVIPKLKEGKSTFAEMLGGTMPKITVDVPLSDGMTLQLGNHQYKVLSTPGHSIGSICFHDKKNQVLFSGDTIFANGGFGRYDFPGGDFSTLLQSITRLTTLDVSCLYPGHGPIVEHHGKNHVLDSLQNIQSLV
jgi:hydroxyacylglutathione hydrolase